MQHESLTSGLTEPLADALTEPLVGEDDVGAAVVELNQDGTTALTQDGSPQIPMNG